jgi:hypothetical protein
MMAQDFEERTITDGLGKRTPEAIHRKDLGGNSNLPAAEKGLEIKGGLGSSHTAPCGAAVPARPPTRS